MENGIQTDTLVMDFEKIFDKVNHSLLPHKMNSFGINKKSKLWIQNFLYDNTQQVVVNRQISEPTHVKSGTASKNEEIPAF